MDALGEAGMAAVTGATDTRTLNGAVVPPRFRIPESCRLGLSRAESNKLRPRCGLRAVSGLGDGKISRGQMGTLATSTFLSFSIVFS